MKESLGSALFGLGEDHCEVLSSRMDVRYVWNRRLFHRCSSGYTERVYSHGPYPTSMEES